MKTTELTFAERRLIAFALCALVECTPPENQSEVQIDATTVATKLGIIKELSLAISVAPASKPQAKTE